MSIRTLSPVSPVRIPQPGNRPSILREAWTIRGVLIAIILAMILSPALAEIPSPGQSGDFARGIPVYWPFHALFMAAGVLLLLSGAVIAALRRPARWYERHVVLELAGGACILAGLAIGVWMVTLSGLPQLRNSHGVLGATIAALLVLVITLGISVRRMKGPKQGVRPAHRWLGRIALLLLLINTVLGIQVLLFILSR